MQHRKISALVQPRRSVKTLNMLIVSKFKDYYDSVGHTTGIDKTIVYERKYEKLENQKSLIVPKEYGTLWYPGAEGRGIWRGGKWYIPKRDAPYVKEAEYFLVGFAGKLYIGVKKTVTNVGYMVSDRYEFEYGDALINTLESNYSKDKNKRKSQVELVDILKKYHNAEYTHLFFALDTPIFMQKISTRNNHPIHINPELGPLLFYKEKDSFTAYQELMGFISGVLGTNRKQPVETDDKYKILAAGFDLKTSFRKDKQS